MWRRRLSVAVMLGEQAGNAEQRTGGMAISR
jgi:hypothetical protein